MAGCRRARARAGRVSTRFTGRLRLWRVLLWYALTKSELRGPRGVCGRSRSRTLIITTITCQLHWNLHIMHNPTTWPVESRGGSF